MTVCAAPGCTREVPPGTRRPRLYCSRRCRQRAWQARHDGVQQDGRGKVEEVSQRCVAPGCDRPMPPGSRSDRRTCSDRCRVRMSRAR